jgi:prophage tail gpP-like protein
MTATLATASPAPAVPATDSGGDVAIWVRQQKISGWQSVQITRSIETCPNHFSLSMTEVYPTDPTRILVQPGEPCQIYIGNDLVINGYVDRVTIHIGPAEHTVEVSGRGRCQDLVDCSADLLKPNSKVQGGTITATDVVDLAKQLCDDFGIDVICNATDRGPPIRSLTVGLGETPFQVIEKVARYAGFLIYEDEHANLMLDRVGTRPMASGFAQGVNVEAAAVTFSTDQRFTDYTIVYSTIDQVQEGADQNVWNRRADTVDASLAKLGRKRPWIIASTQNDLRPEYAQRMVNWEAVRRYGRSQAVQLSCDSWRDSQRRLWQPNWLAPLDLPALKLKNPWIIATVTFRKDVAGTHADLLLMPPAAFAVQPNPLTLFDPELIYSTLNPAPPSQTGPGGLQGHV